MHRVSIKNLVKETVPLHTLEHPLRGIEIQHHGCRLGTKTDRTLRLVRPRQRKEGTFGCSLSLSFFISLFCALSLTLTLSFFLCALRSALLSLNITANDDESGETGDSNGRVKTLARRPLSRTVGREKWFAPRRVPVVHIRARRPTEMFTRDTDEDFQLVRLR